MSNLNNPHTAADADAAPAFSMRAAELAVALLIALIGAIVMTGSYSQGIGWNDVGPEPGYFPFRIGLLMCAASIGTIAITLRHWNALAAGFVARGPFRHVVTVFVPMCLYGIAIRLMGLYLASALFIAWFMWREREESSHGLLKTAVVSIGAVIAAYFIFEHWFQVRLYAGPLVHWLNAGN